jgi:hypothetical protein
MFRKLVKLVSIGFVAVMTSTPATAELEKTAQISCSTGEICFTVWPKLPDTPGWHSNPDVNVQYDMYALAPDGLDFPDAETVIYAVARDKARQSKLPSLDALMKGDVASAKAHLARTNRGVSATEVAPLATGDGRKLRTLAFVPVGGGRWEEVSYGEEGGYYVIFTISASSESALRASFPVFESLLSKYKQ